MGKIKQVPAPSRGEEEENNSSFSAVLRAQIGLYMVWALTAVIEPQWMFGRSPHRSLIGSSKKAGSSVKFANRSGPALRLNALHSAVWPATLGMDASLSEWQR